MDLSKTESVHFSQNHKAKTCLIQVNEFSRTKFNSFFFSAKKKGLLNSLTHIILASRISIIPQDTHQ